MPWESEALNYRGLAYVAAAKASIGSSPDLPAWTFEWQFSVDPMGIGPDANPATVVADYLTNPHYGAGFPPEYLGDLTTYAEYCLAAGLVVSPVLSTQAEGRQFLEDLMAATNSECVWSGGKLTVVPYGDTALAANGATYTPPSEPLFALTDTDFKKLNGSNNNSTAGSSVDGPIACTQLSPNDQPNQWSVEFLDRTNNYNPGVVTVSDDAGVALHGLRPADRKQLHFFTLAGPANVSAQLTMGRAQVVNTYAFTLGPEYIVLDPMDIVAISDAALGLDQQWVRITEITENDDNSLTIQAEEYLEGTGHAPAYAMQTPLGYLAAYSDAPATPWTYTLWQPTYAVSGGFEIWIAGSGPAQFGGFDVWVSTDDTTYRLVGRQGANARMGTLTAALAAVTPAGTGMTIDTSHTLAVDMTASGQQLLSGTAADAQAGNTLCWVGVSGTQGEYLAYETATLGSGETYALTYLRRGMFDTTPQAAAAGAAFVRLIGGSVFRFGLTTDRIGSTLFFKLLPFNLYGGGQPTLDEVTAYAITVAAIAPGAPTALSVVPGNRSNALSWQAAPEQDVDHYAIWRKIGAAEPSAPVISGAGAVAPLATTAATAWTDADAATLTPGAVAWYWVAAVTLTGGVSSLAGPVTGTSAQIVAADVGTSAVATASLQVGAVSGAAVDTETGSITIGSSWTAMAAVTIAGTKGANVLLNYQSITSAVATIDSGYGGGVPTISGSGGGGGAESGSGSSGG